MRAELERLREMRGRPAFYPYLGSGIGRGARAMLADGRWALDFALGIGVHLFGHGDPDLIATAIRAATSDLVMQGNLIFNREYGALMEDAAAAHAPRRDGELLALARRAPTPTRTRSSCVRYKREGRPGVIAFRGCFHGRTSAMAEITDRPDYRVGQPSTFPCTTSPFTIATTPTASPNRWPRCAR